MAQYFLLYENKKVAIWGACKVCFPENWINLHSSYEVSQLMRLWYLSHRRQAKAQASLRIRAVSLEPSLFAHIK